LGLLFLGAMSDGLLFDLVFTPGFLFFFLHEGRTVYFNSHHFFFDISLEPSDFVFGGVGFLVFSALLLGLNFKFNFYLISLYFLFVVHFSLECLLF